MNWLNKKTILIISAGIIVYWIIDTAIDGYFFLHYTPRQVLVYALRAPGHEIFMRSSTIIAIIVFGLLLTRYAYHLNESEGRYRRLFDTIDDPVFVQTEVTEENPGKFLEFNRAGCRTLGYSREELVQKSPLEIFPHEVLPAVAAWRRKLMAEGQVVFETILVAKDGGQFPVEINAHLFDLFGKTKVMAIARDISERQKAEAALRQAYEHMEQRVAERTGELAQANLELKREIAERRQKEEQLEASEARFRGLVQTAGSSIILLCPDGRILEFNREAERVSGWLRHEVLEGEAIPLFIPEGEQQRAKEILRKGLAGELIRGLEMPARMRDGRERLFRWNLNAIFDPAGKPAGLVMVGDDITEQKQNEIALQESEEKLRLLTAQLMTATETERQRISMELHDELGQALVYHKFQMGLFVQNLGEGGEKSLQADGDSLLAYVDGIIEKVWRLSQDLNPGVLEELGITSAIRYLLEEFNDHHPIRIVQAEIDEIDDLFSKPAQIHIFRVIQESLTNIFRHARASEVSLIVRHEGNVVFVKVADNGQGFNVQEVLSPARRRIGIAAMQERIRILGGTHDIWSKEGSGTRINFTIPVEIDKGVK
jgi:PAS domain S-box-containing protein